MRINSCKQSLINPKTKKDGYIFDGWYADKELTQHITQVKMTKNTTVYAAWKKEISEIGGVGKWLNTTEHYAYVFGYPDGTVRPNDNISRAEMAVVLHRVLTM